LSGQIGHGFFREWFTQDLLTGERRQQRGGNCQQRERELAAAVS
jgi:hypothetical protein